MSQYKLKNNCLLADFIISGGLPGGGVKCYYREGVTSGFTRAMPCFSYERQGVSVDAAFTIELHACAVLIALGFDKACE